MVLLLKACGVEEECAEKKLLQKISLRLKTAWILDNLCKTFDS